MWDELLSETRVSQQIWIEDDSGIAQIDSSKSVPRVVGAPLVYPVGYLSSLESIQKILAARQIRSAEDVAGFRCAETVVCSGDVIEVSGVVKLVPWENQRPEGDPYRCTVDIVPVIVASKGEEIEIGMISSATKSMKWS